MNLRMDYQLGKLLTLKKDINLNMKDIGNRFNVENRRKFQKFLINIINGNIVLMKLEVDVVLNKGNFLRKRLSFVK